MHLHFNRDRFGSYLYADEQNEEGKGCATGKDLLQSVTQVFSVPKIHWSLREDGIKQFNIRGFSEIVLLKRSEGTIVKGHGAVLNIQNAAFYFCYN